MSTYKRFFIKIAVFAVLLIAFDVLMGYVFRYMSNKALEKSPVGMVAEYTMTKVNTDVVIIGSSEVKHSYVSQIFRDSLGLEVYNCGLDAALFYYKNAVINGILDRYVPKIIVWDVTPNELSTIDGVKDICISKLKPYYKKTKFLQDNIDVLSDHENLKMYSQCYIYNSRLIPLLFRMIAPDDNCEYGAYEPLYQNKKGLTLIERGWDGIYDIRKELVFKNTIERCLQKGTKVVFVFTPRFEKENHENLQSYISLKIIAQSYNIPLIEDLYHDKSLMKVEYFKDNAHLNDAGAHQFSQMLANKLHSLSSN